MLVKNEINRVGYLSIAERYYNTCYNRHYHQFQKKDKKADDSLCCLITIGVLLFKEFCQINIP